MAEPFTTPSPLRQALRSAFAWPVSKRSLIIALVVGTILNLLNQGDFLVAGGGVNWLKVALTYCVPFFVSSYGAYSAFRAGAAEDM